MDVLFRDARSQNRWLPRDVPRETLQELHDLLKWGPTSANCWPQRVVFTVTEEAKERLASIAMPGNQGQDPAGAGDRDPGLRPGVSSRRWTCSSPTTRAWPRCSATTPNSSEVTAFRNATLQGAYFMLAARSLGLDCGPMSGFDNAKCDELFFPGTTVRSNFLCSIGYGDPEGLFGRLPRPEFDDVCRVGVDHRRQNAGRRIAVTATISSRPSHIRKISSSFSQPAKKA